MKLSKEELKDYAVLRFALEDYDLLDDETANKFLENAVRILFENEE